MFRKSLKLLMLSLLCLLTLSCSLLVEEETGSISFTLPEARSVMQSRGNETNGSVKYHVTITPELSNFTDFSYDKDNLSGSVHIDRVPVGKYRINVTAKNDRYSFFMKEPLSFTVSPGKLKVLPIELDCELIPSQKPEEKTGGFKISFNNQFSSEEIPTFTLELLDPKTNNSLYEYSAINKFGNEYEGINVGSYKYIIQGQSLDADYYYESKANEVLEIKSNGVTPLVVTLKKTEINKPTPEPGIQNVGIIKGSVILPRNRTNITLLLTAKNDINEYRANVESDGSFIIKNVLVGEYSITVSGNSDEGSYKESSISTVHVLKNQDNVINPISLTETLNKRKIKINTTTSITDDARFTIDIKEGASETSVNGYPKSNQTLPFTSDSLEPGNYKVIVNGEGNTNRYNAEEIIKVGMGPSNIDVTHDIALNVVSKKGNLNGQIKGDATFDGVTLMVTAIDKNKNVFNGTIDKNVSYSFTDLPIGEYTIKVTSKLNNESLNVSYTGEIIVVIKDNQTITQDITITSSNVLGNIAGTVTLPKIGLNLTAKAILKSNGEIKNSATVNPDSGYFDINSLPEGLYTIKIEGKDSIKTYDGTYDKVTVTKNKRNTIQDHITLNEKSSSLKLSFTNMPLTPISLTIKLTKGTTEVGSYTSKSDKTLSIPDLVEGSDYSLDITGEDNEQHYNYSQKNISVEPGTETSITANMIAIPKKGNLVISFLNGPTPAIILNVNVSKDGQVVQTKKVSSDKTITIENLPIGAYKIEVSGKNDTDSYSYVNEAFTVNENQKNTLNASLTIKQNPSVPTSLFVSSSTGDDNSGDGSENAPYGTLTKAISVISDLSKEYTLNLIGNFNESINIDKEIKLTIHSKPNLSAKINGEIKVDNPKAVLNIDTLEMTTSNPYTLIINRGQVYFGDYTIIGNTNNSKEAVVINDEGFLQIDGESEIESYIKINNSNKTPFVNVNNVSLSANISKIKINNIEAYKTNPVIKVINGMSYDAAFASFPLADTNYKYNTNGTVSLIETIPSDTIIKPDPSKGIFCVDENSGTDSNNTTGEKPFKTLSKVLNIGKTINKVYVSGTINETTELKLPKNIVIENQKGTTAILNTNSIIGLSLLDGGVATINGITINHTYTGSDGFGIKMPDSVTLTLGKGTKIKTTGPNKNAISLGSQATLSLNSPENIDSTNNIKVLNGGKIKTQTGFSDVAGNIVLDFTSNGDRKRQLITAEDPEKIAAVSAKFSIIGRSYTINEQGQLITDGGSSGGGGSETVNADIWDYSALQTHVDNGGIFGLPQSFQFSGTININTNVTFIVKSDVTFIRANNFNGAFFNISPTGSLTIRRAKDSTTGSATFDGNNVKDTESIIVANGNINLNNCKLIRNGDSALKCVGNVIAHLRDTKIQENTAIGNGGGIFLDIGSDNSFPELFLEGNTIISKNSSNIDSGYGGGIYSKYGLITLSENAKITADNTTSQTNRGNSIYFENLGENGKLNGNPAKQKFYEEEITLASNK